MTGKRSTVPRVLMLLENSVFPMDVRVRQEAETLRAAGYQVTVICPGGRGQATLEVVNGVTVHRYPAPQGGSGFASYLWEYGYSMAATLLKSVQLLFREGFDVIHVANPPDSFVLVNSPFKLLGKRIVYDHHDLAPEMYYARFRGSGNRLVYHTLVLLEKLSCRLADHVIATNESYKAIAIDRGGVPPDRITVVRNGPDLQRLRPVEPPPELRPQGKMVIGYAGVMGIQDGVEHLLRALAHLAHDLGRTDFWALLVGPGEALEGLKQLAVQLGIAEMVAFPGWVEKEDMPAYLSAMDICVAPEPSNAYNDNSTMIKIMEYMAVARPIVAFDLPEHRFTAQDAAVFVPPNDELELARALAELMDDPQRREAMGAFGRRRIETELAWPYSARKLLDAYTKVLLDPRKRGGLRNESGISPNGRAAARDRSAGDRGVR